LRAIHTLALFLGHPILAKSKSATLYIIIIIIQHLYSAIMSYADTEDIPAKSAKTGHCCLYDVLF